MGRVILAGIAVAFVIRGLAIDLGLGFVREFRFALGLGLGLGRSIDQFGNDLIVLLGDQFLGLERRVLERIAIELLDLKAHFRDFGLRVGGQLLDGCTGVWRVAGWVRLAFG
ncbi:hypothetical protein, partial [Bradyrhizobium sp.]|uniref:hypothetical protein n=1 Tax=Bradyrhizobium sp. TaxID=376 RepID=UPI003918829D